MTKPSVRAAPCWSAFALLVLAGCSEHDNLDPPKHEERKHELPAGAAAADAGRAAPALEIPKILTVSGPVSDAMGKPATASAADLSGLGYSEKEFFFSGAASAYTLAGGMSMDGRWSLSESTRAAFKTRLLVRRPNDASKFNGTVFVEWLNVSAGADGDPGFMYNSAEILREGYAYVGVSAQAAGVEGGGFSLGGAGSLPLKQQDPQRYGSLRHPGDDYSFDIFTQAADVIRDPSHGDVLEGLQPDRLIAYGESQSAMRMVSYVNGVHPLVDKYDGFFIHSRGAAGVPFSSAGGLDAFGGFGGTPVWIRDDIAQKVFQFQTETDVTGMLAFLPARQPDSDRLRTWEVAGTAHADQFIVDFNASSASDAAVTCDNANNGPSHFVINAALHSLDAWLRDGTEPPRGEPLQTHEDGTPMTDEHGNTVGGVRTPDVDVPISTLSGAPAADYGGNFWCILFGHTTPFTTEQLTQLYPTHDDYVTKVKAAAQKARAAGFVLEPEEQAFVDRARAAAIPK
jgi:hypothetical protein